MNLLYGGALLVQKYCICAEISESHFLFEDRRGVNTKVTTSRRRSAMLGGCGVRVSVCVRARVCVCVCVYVCYLYDRLAGTRMQG